MKMSQASRYSLNAVCPYYTMFPLEFPFRILKHINDRKTTILDPFCGRGTTNYAAQLGGFKSYGIDSSPVAVAIARAKLANTTEKDVMDLVKKLLVETEEYETPQSEFWEWAYHKNTLDQLCRIRAGLRRLKDSHASVTLRAIILGCLHGPKMKDNTNPSYFSNQMPRTFSSKPGYSIKYWSKNCITATNVDVRKPILKKARRILVNQHVSDSKLSNIIYGDSRDYLNFVVINEKVNLVITSPPYYGMRTYIQDQWLRNWFLGGSSEVNYSCEKQIDHSSPYDFVKSLSKTWDNIYNIAADDIRMIIRFGGIPSRDPDHSSLLLDSLSDSAGDWRVYYRRDVGSSSSGKRQAMHMGGGSISTPTGETDFYIKLQ